MMNKSKSNMSSENKIEDAVINRVSYLIKDNDVFTDDLKYHLVKKILNGNKKKFQKLLFDTKIQDLATK